MTADAKKVLSQWRGSDDGIVWTEWRDWPGKRAQIPEHNYYQGRKWVGGKWVTTKIESCVYGAS